MLLILFKKLTNEYEGEKELQGPRPGSGSRLCLPGQLRPRSRPAGWPRIPGPAAPLNGSAGSHRPAARQPARFPAALPSPKTSPTQRQTGKRSRGREYGALGTGLFQANGEGKTSYFLNRLVFRGPWAPDPPHLSLPLSSLGEHLPVQGKRDTDLYVFTIF